MRSVDVHRPVDVLTLILSWKCNGKTVTEAIPLCDIGERKGWRRMKAGGLSVTSKKQYTGSVGGLSSTARGFEPLECGKN